MFRLICITGETKDHQLVQCNQNLIMLVPNVEHLLDEKSQIKVTTKAVTRIIIEPRQAKMCLREFATR